MIINEVVRNPLIAGVMAGLAVLVVRQWQLNHFGAVVFSLERDLAPLYEVLGELKAMTTPLALIVLGGQFRFSAVRGMFREIAVGTVWRTVLTPIIGLGGAVLLSRMGLLQCGTAEYPALIALFGSPVAVSSAIMAKEMHNDEQLATQLLVWTSVVSIVTIFGAVCLLMSLGFIAV
jgi:predicted permease